MTKRQLQKMYEETLKILDEEREDNKKLIESFSSTIDRNYDTVKEMNDKIISLQNEVKNLTEENEILRKYCHADREPTEEEQAKILMNLRIHDLEKEIEKLNRKISENNIINKELELNRNLATYSLGYLSRSYYWH